MSTLTIDKLAARVRARRMLPAPSERRRLREAAGLSRQALAEAVGVTNTAVFFWESGECEPSGPNLEGYLQVLDMLRRELGEAA